MAFFVQIVLQLAFALGFVSAQYQQSYNGTQNSPYYAQQHQQQQVPTSSVEHNQQQMYASSSSSHSVYYGGGGGQQWPSSSSAPQYATGAAMGAAYGIPDYHRQQQQQQYGWPASAAGNVPATTANYNLPYTHSLAASGSGTSSSPYPVAQQRQYSGGAYGSTTSSGGAGTADYGGSSGSHFGGGYGNYGQQQQRYGSDGMLRQHQSNDGPQQIDEQHQWHHPHGDGAIINNHNTDPHYNKNRIGILFPTPASSLAATEHEPASYWADSAAVAVADRLLLVVLLLLALVVLAQQSATAVLF
ncbi:hypothetical protein niasHS_005338 [Heterodera schachtii]|uniref:Uncharacterized protein n=2 Tax=Heterodera TaxID=34509 RepID=A0ABD2J965_HETSC